MAEIKPIGLKNEGQANQQHAPFAAGDKIPSEYINLTELISGDANNALRLGSDGLLYAKKCCEENS